MELHEILAKGITGFCDCDAQPYKLIDYEFFKTKCFELARQLGGRILYIDDDACTTERNFRIARIGDFSLPFSEISFEVLVNVQYPVIGLVKERESESIEACYIDIGEVKNFFEGSYLVISKQQLEENFNYMNKGLENILYKYEIKQIMYWKPKKLGEVLFNYWD